MTEQEALLVRRPTTMIDTIVRDPGRLAGWMSPYAEAIISKVTSIEPRDEKGDQTLQSTATRSFASLTLSEPQAVVSILGERGSGKTTLLQLVCAQLLRMGNYIVLPVIYPEFFADGDTLTGWVLTALRNILELQDQRLLSEELNIQGQTYSLSAWLDLVRQHEALVQRGYAEGLANQSLSMSEFGRDAVQLSSLGASFAADWHTLVSAVTELWARRLGATSTRNPLLVIPVDDPDLRPDLIPSMFIELRRLASHPSVVALICVNHQSARTAMLAHALREGTDDNRLQPLLTSGLINSHDIAHSVNKQLMKVLPVDKRVSLPPLSPDQRLAFTPISSPDTMLDLLMRVPLKSVPYLRTLADLFTLRDANLNRLNLVPSPYVACLSDNPRDMDQLCRALAQINANYEGTSRHSAVAARAIIDHAIDVAAAGSVTPEARPLTWVDDPSQKLGLEFDLRPIEITMQVHIAVTVRSTTIAGHTARSRLRAIGDRLAFLRDSHGATDQDDEAPLGRTRLPHALVMALYLARSLSNDIERSADRPFRFLGQFGDFGNPGLERWTDFFSVSVDREATDNRFWVVPGWDDQYDFFLYTRVWNQLVDLCNELPFDPPDEDFLIDWCLMKHLELITRVQSSRRITRAFWDGRSAVLRQLLTGERLTEPYIRKAEAYLERSWRALYARGKRPNAPVRDRDFCTWFDLGLPWACDRVASSEETSSWILRIREEIIRSNGDLAAANSAAAGALARRIGLSIDRDWVWSTIDLLGRFDPAIADQVRTQWETARGLRDEAFRNEVDRLRRAGVTETILRRLEMFGLTPELVQALVDGGVPRDYVDQLSQRFLRPYSIPSREDDSPRVLRSDRGV
jgi:hypothetical protein